VTLVGLLGVVVDELFDVGLDEADFGEDFVGGGGPFERFGLAVPGFDVGPDPCDESRDRRERAASDRLTGDDAEPDLD
jgi:hypothetical protein